MVDGHTEYTPSGESEPTSKDFEVYLDEKIAAENKAGAAYLEEAAQFGSDFDRQIIISDMPQFVAQRVADLERAKAALKQNEYFPVFSFLTKDILRLQRSQYEVRRSIKSLQETKQGGLTQFGEETIALSQAKINKLTPLQDAALARLPQAPQR